MAGPRSVAPTFLLGLSLAAATALAAPPPVATGAGFHASAAPGQVVRWEGDGTTRCGTESRTWPPLAGVCWYPIDLLAPEGETMVTRWAGAASESAVVRVTPAPYGEERLTVDPRTVVLSRRDRARVERERKAVAPLFALRGPAAFSLPLGPPLFGAPPATNFGRRRFLNGEPRSPHGGVDFAVPAGTPVRSVADGRVVLVARHFFSGLSVYVDHGDGLISMSFHLSRARVRTGQRVKRGAEIGRVGATGRASGPHLHLGLRWRGARVDPTQLIEGAPDVPTVTRDGAGPQG